MAPSQAQAQALSDIIIQLAKTFPNASVFRFDWNDDTHEGAHLSDVQGIEEDVWKGNLPFFESALTRDSIGLLMKMITSGREEGTYSGVYLLLNLKDSSVNIELGHPDRSGPLRSPEEIANPVRDPADIASSIAFRYIHDRIVDRLRNLVAAYPTSKDDEGNHYVPFYYAMQSVGTYMASLTEPAPDNLQMLEIYELAKNTVITHAEKEGIEFDVDDLGEHSWADAVRFTIAVAPMHIYRSILNATGGIGEEAGFDIDRFESTYHTPTLEMLSESFWGTDE